MYYWSLNRGSEVQNWPVKSGMSGKEGSREAKRAKGAWKRDVSYGEKELIAGKIDGCMKVREGMAMEGEGENY